MYACIMLNMYWTPLFITSTMVIFGCLGAVHPLDGRWRGCASG